MTKNLRSIMVRFAHGGSSFAMACGRETSNALGIVQRRKIAMTSLCSVFGFGNEEWVLEGGVHTGILTVVFARLSMMVSWRGVAKGFLAWGGLLARATRGRKALVAKIRMWVWICGWGADVMWLNRCLRLKRQGRDDEVRWGASQAGVERKRDGLTSSPDAGQTCLSYAE